MKKLNVIDLGNCPYGKAWDIQKEIHTKRIAGEIPDTLILVEHPHVYTLGKNANAQHLIASQDYLKSKGIEIYNVDRGGDITYHGPGQLVGYPIFNLKNHRKSVSWYVHTVEDVLIQMLADYGISAERIDKLTGVWVGNQKIAALGMRVSKWVTMHGFALNVSTDLSLYDGIIPCGIVSKGITRIADLVPDVQWKNVKKRVIDKFKLLFNFDSFVKSDYRCHSNERSEEEFPMRTNRDSSLVPRSSQRDLFEGMTDLILSTIPSILLSSTFLKFEIVDYIINNS